MEGSQQMFIFLGFLLLLGALGALFIRRGNLQEAKENAEEDARIASICERLKAEYGIVAEPRHVLYASGLLSTSGHEAFVEMPDESLRKVLLRGSPLKTYIRDGSGWVPLARIDHEKAEA